MRDFSSVDAMPVLMSFDSKCCVIGQRAMCARKFIDVRDKSALVRAQFRGGDNRYCRHEAMRNWIHRNSEALKRAHSEKAHITRFGKNDFINCLVSFRADNRVARVTLDDL